MVEANLGFSHHPYAHSVNYITGTKDAATIRDFTEHFYFCYLNSKVVFFS